MTFFKFAPLSALFLLVAAFSVFAQEATPQSAIYETVKADFAATQKTISDLDAKLQTALQATARDDAALADLKLKAEAGGQDISRINAALTTRYGLVTKRLAELGEPPTDGTLEVPVLTQDRKRLVAEKLQLNALMSEGERLGGMAGDLVNHITDIRRDLFTDALLARTVLTPDMAIETLETLASEAEEFSRRVTSWAKFVWSFKRGQLLAALFFSLISALVLVSGARRVIDPLIRREHTDENPAYISRLSIAFWSTIVPSLSVGIFAALSLLFLDSFNILRQDIAPVLSAFLTVLVGVYFVWRLARGVVAPGKPQWRLLDVSNKGARLLVVFAMLMAIVNGLDYWLTVATTTLDSPVVLTIAKSFVATVLIGLLLIAMAFIKPMNEAANEPQIQKDGPWPPPIRYALWMGGSGLIVATLLGYVGLARFVSTQLVITGTIMVTMYIGYLSGKAVSRADAFGKTIVGRFLKSRYGLHEIRLAQGGLAAGLGIYLLVLTLGLPVILLQWGFQTNDIRAMAVRIFTDITIGNITISLFGILGGIIVFVIGMVLTRWFQAWLDGNVMERSQVDSGVRNSVNTALGYLGIALAGLLGVSAAGIDLSSLALVAGALSLGIGFGLQNIVSNFVSGLILLAERPFKVGDWVVTGTTEGFVKRISVRATEIETFQHQSIIVPNAELINSSLGNWTHRNKIGRSEIQVGVSYDSDPGKVMDLLLEIANTHPLVLKTPETMVAFLRFGDFSLDFELRFYLADLLNGTMVRNDIRVAIIERFRHEGIEIPFPQRNLNIRFDGDNGNLEATLADEPFPPEAIEKITRAAEMRRVKMQSHRHNDANGDERV